MKAKTVNEKQYFERGLDPKDSMGVGAVYERNFKKMETKVNAIVQEAHDLGITYKDMQEIFYGSLHINTTYSDEAYLSDPNNFEP